MSDRINQFNPAWWLPGPHCQTIWSRFFRSTHRLPTHRQRLELPDGDFVDLDWNQIESGPIVLILHGLGGSIESHYAQGLMSAITARGWRGVVMHFRGCSGETNRLAQSYHAGETTDLSEVIMVLQTMAPNQPIVAVGYSLGGNVLLKWLGESQSSALTAAVAVSVPFDLSLSAARLNQGFSKIYQWYLLSRLKAATQGKAHLLQEVIQLDAAMQTKTIREFDDMVTAPLHGFLHVDDYYSKSSSRPYLKMIQTPTLIIHAKDDPFVATQAIPHADELSDAITFQLTERGGHVGFVSGSLKKPDYWLESAITDYLDPYLTDKFNRSVQ